MRKCKIDIALDKLNAKNGLTYPMIGYSYFADIKGNGCRYGRRYVYTIINENGGVSYSELNGRSYVHTATKINATLIRE